MLALDLFTIPDFVPETSWEVYIGKVINLVGDSVMCQAADGEVKTFSQQELQDEDKHSIKLGSTLLHLTGLGYAVSSYSADGKSCQKSRVWYTKILPQISEAEIQEALVHGRDERDKFEAGCSYRSLTETYRIPY